VNTVRYAKTPKGHDEISARRNNLRGKMRTMLILVDPSKPPGDLLDQGARIGVEPDFLDVLVRDGYVAPLTAANGSALPRNGTVRPLNGTAVVSDGGLVAHSPVQHEASAGAPTQHADHELGRFRAAKAFMNDTVVSVLGLRAFMFTLRLERCATRADLQQLVPDYEKALRKVATQPEARAIAERVRELLA